MTLKRGCVVLHFSPTATSRAGHNQTTIGCVTLSRFTTWDFPSGLLCADDAPRFERKTTDSKQEGPPESPIGGSGGPSPSPTFLIVRGCESLSQVRGRERLDEGVAEPAAEDTQPHHPGESSHDGHRVGGGKIAERQLVQQVRDRVECL